MNILQVCAYAAPYPGNFMKSLLAVDKKLKEKGHNTYYAFPETAKNCKWCDELSKKTKVFFLPLAKARIKPKTYMELRNIIKNENIEIIHSHFELYDMPIALTLPKDSKMFWHLHDAIENDYKNHSFIRKILFKLHYGILSKRAYLISVSDKHKNFAIKLGFNPENSKTILNATDLTRIRIDKVNSCKKYDFLIFGWDFERKGVDLAIKAGKELNKEGYKFNLMVVGSNDTWKNKKIYEVENEKWFIKKNFVDDVNELYENAKVFLHPSRAEGCSYALQESIYSGLPIISSDIPENLFAQNIPTVKLFKSNDFIDLYTKMKEFLNNKELITTEDIVKSREIIKNNYSIDVWADKIVNEYSRLVKL